MIRRMLGCGICALALPLAALSAQGRPSTDIWTAKLEGTEFPMWGAR